MPLLARPRIAELQVERVQGPICCTVNQGMHCVIVAEGTRSGRSGGAPNGKHRKNGIPAREAFLRPFNMPAPCACVYVCGGVGTFTE